MRREKKIYARRRDYFADDIEIHIAECIDDKFSVMTNIIFEDLPSGVCAPPSPLVLEIKVAQRLMDELWNCGLRPSEGTGSAGAMAAAQNHIKDLQEMMRRSMGVVERLAVPHEK